MTTLKDEVYLTISLKFMSPYHILKKLVIKRFISSQKRIVAFNRTMNARTEIKEIIYKYDIPKLKPDEIKAAKSYYKSQGYQLKNTSWHRYYKAVNGQFHKEYIPLDIFNSKISPRLNQKIQWPALLDKNLSYNLFKDFDQPKRVLQNINGLYYLNDKVVDESEAILKIKKNTKLLIIKPSIESGGGRMVVSFKVEKETTSYKNMSIESLLKLYKKDFIIQEFLEQSEAMKMLNPTSLNTLRVISYLNNDGANLLLAIVRIGQKGSYTDNYETGGILCGVDDNGKLNVNGYTKEGTVVNETFTGIKFCDFVVPNYNSIVDMVKSMHVKVPYFKIISWDIAINNNNSPVMVEFNTYNQGLDVQIAYGPLFGEFTTEILAKGLEPY